MFYTVSATAITILFMIAIHVYVYFKLSAKSVAKYGNQPLPPVVDLDAVELQARAPRRRA